jgi:hypothetical protein
MPKTVHKGAAAQIILFGNRKAVYLLQIAKNHEWNNEEKKYADKIKDIDIVVMSPSTRNKNYTIKVPPEGFTMSLTDDDLDAIAESNGIFPLVAFEGLTVEPWSSKDSKAVNYKTDAKRVFLCDENGKPKQP